MDWAALFPIQEGAHERDDKGRELIMNELTKEQADDLRRTAEYLTLQMRLTPHPTERTRIRVMADTADYVAERIDAFLRAGSQENTHASRR
jgi:phosphoenolpyruvate carboxylase